MTNRLTCFGLRLPGNGTGVDNDQIRLIGIDKGKTGSGKISGDAIGFNTVDAAAEIDDGNKGIGHARLLVEDIVHSIADTVTNAFLGAVLTVVERLGEFLEEFTLLV